VKESAAQRTQVLVAQAEHAEVLAEFYRTVWDPAATAEEVAQSVERDARENPGAGDMPAPTFIVLAEGKCVGFVTTIPGRVWAGGGEVQGYWLKGLMVLPAFRNGPVGFLLIKEAIRHLRGYLFGMAVAPAARKLFQALKFTDLGAVPNRLAPLAPATIAHHLDLEALNISGLPGWVPPVVRVSRVTGLDRAGGAALGLLRSGYAGLASRGAGSLSAVNEGGRWKDYEVDRLWARMQTRISAGAVRNGAYVRWRYAQASAEQYEIVTARRSGELAAVAALKRPRAEADPRLRGIKVATLSDLIYDPADESAGLAALIGAEREAKKMGAHALLAGATGPAILGLLRRRGYVSIPGNVHFLVRSPTPEAPPLPLADWWVTRGDGESDGF
jgi:GNAT superfamily N-acetyltransferase